MRHEKYDSDYAKTPDYQSLARTPVTQELHRLNMLDSLFEQRGQTTAKHAGDKRRPQGINWLDIIRERSETSGGG